MAEIELSVLGSQCLARRIAERDIVTKETEAWQRIRNKEGTTIKWRFTVQQARTKLAHLYPPH